MNEEERGTNMAMQSDCFYCTDEHKKYMQEICKLKVSTVFLNNEQEYRGRCFVVLNSHKTELFQLEPEERSSLIHDVSRVAQALHHIFTPDKINYAVYGDIDSHIHFHVVPKHKYSKNWGWPFELTAAEGNQVRLSDEQFQETAASIRSYLLLTH